MNHKQDLSQQRGRGFKYLSQMQREMQTQALQGQGTGGTRHRGDQTHLQPCQDKLDLRILDTA